MAEVLANFVKPFVEDLGRITLVKIKHLFTYLCYFNSNIQSMRDEARKLEDARARLQMDVEAAKHNAQVILKDVETWLENASKKIQACQSEIYDQIPTQRNGCWGIKSRFRVSRKAVKLTREMKQLMEDRNKLNQIYKPPPPAAQLLDPSVDPLVSTYQEFESRKQIKEEIMDALRAKEVITMGICGMGGVGKTTMAKSIKNKVLEAKLFDEVAIGVVGQRGDMIEIQDKIAESLGLKLDKKTLEARATKLYQRMAKKGMLVILDDIWEKLKLEDLGIPCGSEGCIILFTSRNSHALNEMRVQKICGMGILSETEAWVLFKKIAGNCVDDPNLNSIAKKVVRECNGLPLALETVGGALKDQTSIGIWEDALLQLQNANPDDIPNVIEKVYNPLKLSYTKLENRRAQSLFLLCSLFPEDVDISLEELTSYCIGLHMFPDLDNVSNASKGILDKVRGRVSTIVDILKKRFLVLKGKDESHVRMHDVVRDVAIYITSHGAKEDIAKVKINPTPPSSEHAYQWVSVFSEETSSLLRMHGSNWVENFEIQDFSIFKGIEQLNLLSFRYILVRSLQLEIKFLKNLRTLRLEYCTLKFLSGVGELLSLEIFYCFCCYGIEELPVEIGNLNQLKVLDFSHTPLRRIPPGVISNLVQLEEFKMFFSFNKWELAAAEVQRQEGRNACLNEFEKLSKLTCLEIEIKDFNLAAEEISFSPNIIRHRVRIGERYLHNRL